MRKTEEPIEGNRIYIIKLWNYHGSKFDVVCYSSKSRLTKDIDSVVAHTKLHSKTHGYKHYVYFGFARLVVTKIKKSSPFSDGVTVEDFEVEV